ncbi:hypothetical protein [Paenibacillus sp. HJGM_3]|uniref:hypothetical protein n=1 Tax=Paenibacillus sp. HJGM_3 TaxID=3379816 RepID=UPI00385CF63C
MAEKHPIPKGTGKRVAAIVTEYRFNSHADVILGRLLGDFDYLPQVEVVSIYTDQVPDNDMSRAEAERCGIPIYATIEEALKKPIEGGGLDGVILIGEHGDYPEDERRRKQYPRRRLLEETLSVLDELNVRIPIFSDKHLSYNIEDTVWMYGQLKSRGIPFMGGSSIPHAPHVPKLQPKQFEEAKEILVVSFSTAIEAYGYHALEVLQSVAEKRSGGETGVQEVYALEGEQVWKAMDRGEWPEELMMNALALFDRNGQPHPCESGDSPVLFIVEYKDGTKGYVIQQNRLSEQWAFAVRNEQGEIASAICDSEKGRPFGHFETLTRLVEQFMMTGTPSFPMERVYMSSGLTNYAMESLYLKRRLETPELLISY